jgi:hypothetical protein
MKKLWILAAAVAIAALFAACGALAKTSVDDCISNFMSDLNSGDRSNVYTNLDSSSSEYAEAKTALYWDLLFHKGETYTLSNRSANGTTVTGAFSSTTTYAGSWDYTLVFVMATDPLGNAVIHSITLNGVSKNNSTQTMTIDVYK